MVNETKHTPGPWQNRGGLEIETSNFNTIAKVLSGTWCSSADQRDADIRLIAAAPELLEACKLFEDLTRNGQPAGSEDLELLQAAIVKAEGK